jgi:hypothetical protein
MNPIISRSPGDNWDKNRNFPLYPVGGSIASPFIPRNKSFHQKGGNEVSVDDKFLSNMALFDRYYFSSIPQQNHQDKYPPFTTGSDFATEFKNYDGQLPNSRIRYYNSNESALSITNLRDRNKAAANLMIDGPFNINSTSVDAWIALLSSLSGNNLRIRGDDGTEVTLTKATLENPISRLSAPTGTTVNDEWSGLRALTDSEIRELAEQIVVQVKTRGPFLSLSDFINRRLTIDELGLKGALQAAIDDSSINNSIATSGDTVDASSNFVAVPSSLDFFPDHVSENSAKGIPGWLMQHDLISNLSPVMTPRSDTFIIRAYGESEKTNRNSATAYCEAVVQRVPEFIEHTTLETDTTKDTPWASLTSLNNSANQRFGRRFKVLSLRWITPSSI